MEVTPRLIIDYITPDGKDIFNDWLMSLKDGQTKAIIGTRIERVKSGNLGDCKPVGEGVFELRFTSGIRIYYAEMGRIVILLLCGGNKSSHAKDIL
jgi:putative addiction module killer protein